jgi:hypothetical protein
MTKLTLVSSNSKEKIDEEKKQCDKIKINKFFVIHFDNNSSKWKCARSNMSDAEALFVLNLCGHNILSSYHAEDEENE